MTATFRKQKKLLLMRATTIFVWLAVALLTLCVCHSAKADELARGVVVEKIVCQRDAGQSYALYLPSSYRPEKKWPVLYAFDPIARGPLPVARFKEAAERYGYIVVGSNNSRNGPVKPAIEAAEAMWRDTHARFAIDDNRVYMTGFSGGARVAGFAASRCENCVAGVIACGAGFNREIAQSKQTTFAVFATVGIDDFNYPELMEFNLTLEKYGILHRVATFEGTHAWPPPELCAEAIEWMEIQAIKSGRRPKDEALVHELFDKTLKKARALEEQKKIYEAYDIYQSLVTSYKGLLDISEVEKKTAELKASKKFKERSKEEKEQLEQQRALAVELIQLTRPPDDQDNLVVPLGDLRKRVAELRKRAEATEDTGERRVARRALWQVFAQFYEAGMVTYANNRSEATARLEIAAEIAPRDPSVFYQLAILYAQSGEKRRSLDALRHAVENGLADPSLIESNKDLNRLREEPDYRKIVDALKTK